MKLYKLILLLAFLAAGILLVLGAINHGVFNVQQESTSTSAGQNQGRETPNPNNYTVLISGNVCEGCHLSGKPYIPQAETAAPHINGGAYCLSCHVISHEKHPMNSSITCEKCHGTTPSMPVYANGTISCNNCHGYPDPLLPSKGNLLTIHRPRGIACTNCHTDNCLKCHAQMGTDERWTKRIEHFKLVAVGS